MSYPGTTYYDNLIFAKHRHTVTNEVKGLGPPVQNTSRVKQKPRPIFVPLKDIRTLTPWSDPNIPFDMFHRPDPIIRMDPRKMQDLYEELPDEVRAKVQKSRPKVIMNGPAADWDALEEPGRKRIIDDIYKTTTAKAQRDVIAMGPHLKNVKAPLPNAYSKCRSIVLECVTEPYVSPEWRRDTVFWDGKQLRSPAEATKMFWLAREKPCLMSEDTAMKQR